MVLHAAESTVVLHCSLYKTRNGDIIVNYISGNCGFMCTINYTYKHGTFDIELFDFNTQFQAIPPTCIGLENVNMTWIIREFGSSQHVLLLLATYTHVYTKKTNGRIKKKNITLRHC